MKKQKIKSLVSKIRFLHLQTYLFYLYRMPPIRLNEVDLPIFIYECQRKQIAHSRATSDLIKVIEECRVEECYKKCLAYLRGEKV